ncbi:uncharacterized protein METZ01_LOCUS304401 [marine metagenome]|uniref:Uncharacterized protein n=1 Tax=marine metagenome TaxID=408172 RepID=A0A382MUW3_9ZZZZ
MVKRNEFMNSLKVVGTLLSCVRACRLHIELKDCSISTLIEKFSLIHR